MTVQTQDFSLANNEDWEYQFTLNAGGDAGDIISQSKVHLTVRPTADSPDVSLSASVENGLLHVDNAASGLVTLSVRAIQMRKLKAGSYVYDLIVERPTGRVYRLYAGTLTLIQGITELTVIPPA